MSISLSWSMTGEHKFPRWRFLAICQNPAGLPAHEFGEAGGCAVPIIRIACSSRPSSITVIA